MAAGGWKLGTHEQKSGGFAASRGIRRQTAGRWQAAKSWGLVIAVLALALVPSYADAVEVTQAAVAVEENSGTAFSLVLSRGVRAEIFTLADPYRVVVDLPDVTFHLPDGTGSDGAGVIKTFRYGLFAERQGRVVIDTDGPVKVLSAGMTREGKDAAVRLKIILVPTRPEDFVAASKPPKPETPANPSASLGAALEPPPGGKPKAKPVIVIDAGHGGIDPGASGLNNVSEKALVLSVAQTVEKELKKSGRYDVKLTRTRDVFVSLDRRLKMSADFGADLFISLHADSIQEAQFAEVIRGATIYTLSEKASDEQARLRAEKENASDLVAGLAGVDDSGKDQVKNILIDLLKRETANFSAEFSNMLAGRLGRSITMSKDPQRSAAFKVLKQTHAPSVLVELGYVSNSKDQGEMASAAWQSKVATAISVAVDSYFAKRTARHP